MIRKTILTTLLLYTNMVSASDYFTLPDSWQTAETYNQPLLLAANEGTSMGGNISAGEEPYKDRIITANKLHKYLGIGSIAAATIGILSPKEEDGPHEAFGKAAAGLGVGAVLTGLLFHWDDLKFSNGFSDPDNLHMALGTLGTLGYLAAVSEAPDPHGGVGGLGYISMAIGIKMTW